MIWLYCQVNSAAPNLTVTWTRDGTPLVEDIPHIRMKNSIISDDVISLSGDNSTAFLLIVDSFQGSDSGVYQCTAEVGEDIVNGTALMLTGTLKLYFMDKHFV